VNKTEPTGEIIEKINANPNPLFFGQRCVISWETNDPAGAEILTISAVIIKSTFEPLFRISLAGSEAASGCAERPSLD
jgi:hypothetical protein